ncbi:MAG: thiamine phosphate synthase [Geminicoccaceae bacterium]
MSRAEETIDAAEAGCQLLLIGPARLDPALFAAQLDAALATGGIAGFVLRPDALEDAQASGLRLAGRLRATCTDHGVAFLLRDHVASALEVGADGVHLGIGAAAVAASRAALGPERILGVSCGHSRDAAMVAGEAGADYVAFGDLDHPAGQEVYDLLEWWSEVCVLPCLAEVATTKDDCARLARAGADFVAAGGSVWTDPDGAAAVVRRFREALEAT